MMIKKEAWAKNLNNWMPNNILDKKRSEAESLSKFPIYKLSPTNICGNCSKLHCSECWDRICVSNTMLTYADILTKVARMLDSLNLNSYRSASRAALFDTYTIRLPCFCNAATPSSAPWIVELKFQSVPMYGTPKSASSSDWLTHTNTTLANGLMFTITVGQHEVERIDKCLAFRDGQIQQIPDAIVADTGVGHRVETLTAEMLDTNTRRQVWMNTDGNLSSNSTTWACTKCCI